MPIHVCLKLSVDFVCTSPVIYVLIASTVNWPTRQLSLKLAFVMFADICKQCVFACVCSGRERALVSWFMCFWEVAQCSCCHTTDQRGFLDRLEGVGVLGRGGMLDGEGGERLTQWGELNEARCTDVSWFESLNIGRCFCYNRVMR